MWLYPEVLPHRPRLRLWMLAPAVVFAVAVVSVIAVPHDDSAIAQVTVIKANLERIHTARTEADLGVHIAKIDYVLRAIGGPSCADACAGEHERVIRERAALQARLRALRARTGLVPQHTTGMPPSCVAQPQAAGCK